MSVPVPVPVPVTVMFMATTMTTTPTQEKERKKSRSSNHNMFCQPNFLLRPVIYFCLICGFLVIVFFSVVVVRYERMGTWIL